METKRKPIFFWSDLHIGHYSVIEFDKRPFKDLNHMHRVLINNYNSTVPENGICYFLGDVGLAKSEVLQKFMGELNSSTKALVLGNHDRNTYSMYEHCFDVVLNSAVIYIGKNRVSMSHCPLPGIFREDVTNMKGAMPGNNWHGEHKNQMFTSQDMTVDFHLHGHIHSAPWKKTPKCTHNQFDVGVSANNFKPVSISEIESWIDRTKKAKK